MEQTREKRKRKLSCLLQALASPILSPVEIVRGDQKRKIGRTGEDGEESVSGASSYGNKTNVSPSLMLSSSSSSSAGDRHYSHDDKGYFVFTPGEKIHGVYWVTREAGRGQFGNVAFARKITVPDNDDGGVGGEEIDDDYSLEKEDSAKKVKLADGSCCSSINELVVVKVMRKVESIRRAGTMEDSILQEIQRSSEKNANEYIVRHLESFYHRDHLCLSFEAMHMNMRAVLHCCTPENMGMSLQGIQRFGQQIFKALECLGRLGIVHADVKLDNILVSKDFRTAKLCDFGCAFHEKDANRVERTSYLASRFYRAPEVLLGLPADQVGKPIDVWALGVCLFELFTRKIVFPGRTNNDMLRLIMRTKGMIPERLIRQHCDLAQRSGEETHFDPTSFEFKELCRKKKVMKLRQITGVRPGHSVSDRVKACVRETQNLDEDSNKSNCNWLRPSSSDGHEKTLMPLFVHLIEGALALDPTERISVADALGSQFFQCVQKI